MIRKVETLAEQYITPTPEKETAVLGVPEICADKIITLYHASLFAGHKGVIKTDLTISNKFFIPNLIHYLRSCIKGCHICQLTCNEKPPTKKTPNQNKLKLYTIVRTEHGFESHA